MWKDAFFNDIELKEVLSRIENLSDYIEKANQSKPYHINVIDELHANENAHTRILIKLLQFTKDGESPFLKSFVMMLNDWNKDTQIINPQIKDNYDYIDGLVMEDGKYAIIIENKIHWAVDQDHQLERYIERVIGYGIPSNKIWVIYLTRDGGKTPANYSLTSKALSVIESRYTPLDYRTHILPWLKEQVLPSCMIKEDFLISAIKQYIDHLEGLFQIREIDKTTNKIMEKKIKEMLGLSEYSSLTDIYERLSKEEEKILSVHQMITNYQKSIEDNVIQSFTNITKEYFTKKYPNRTFNINDRLNSGYYQIWPDEWDSFVHLEWIPLNPSNLMQNTIFTIVLHVENQKATNIIQLINNIENDAEYKRMVPNRLTYNDEDVFYKYSMNCKTPFAAMSFQEQEKTLQGIYDKMLWIIEVIDRCFNNNYPLDEIL